MKVETEHIYKVRHGNTDANNERWQQGHIDTCLSKAGQGQSKLCAGRLQTETYDHVYCSDLTRCKQTAAAILEYHPGVSIDYLDMLREKHLGELSGKPTDHFVSEPKRLSISLDQFVVDNGGESEQELMSRAMSAWDFIVKDAQKKKYNSVLVVIHGVLLQRMTDYWMDTGYSAIDGLEVQPILQTNTSVTRIDVDRKVIYQFNSDEHLNGGDAFDLPTPPAID